MDVVFDTNVLSEWFSEFHMVKAIIQEISNG